MAHDSLEGSLLEHGLKRRLDMLRNILDEEGPADPDTVL